MPLAASRQPANFLETGGRLDFRQAASTKAKAMCLFGRERRDQIAVSLSKRKDPNTTGAKAQIHVDQAQDQRRENPDPNPYLNLNAGIYILIRTHIQIPQTNLIKL